MDKSTISISPWGEAFPIPGTEESLAEMQELTTRARAQREQGREIVVVLGLGFVGTVMAAVVADAQDSAGRPAKFVLALQRPSARSYWKIPLLNRGVPPFASEDPEVPSIIRRCVVERGTLVATHIDDVLTLADVIVVDVQCDFSKRELGNVRSGTVDMAALEETFVLIGQKAPPEALVLIETTVAPGTTEQIAFPIIKQGFEKRSIDRPPLLAHSYERVMPGQNYVASIRDYWRVCSGINAEAAARVTAFLHSVLNTQAYPLTVLDRPIESETAKIIENSYRAAILAFMDEWSLFAERNGVDLKRVIEAIRVRPTHSNMLFPGPGVGGYCLPKDGGLGVWSYRHVLGWEDEIFRITPLAIEINDTRALHVPQLVRDALRNMGEPVAAADVLVLGASYREDVGDTRYSGSELIVRRLTEMGANVRVHDPYVAQWSELALQDESPEASRARFFSRQGGLAALPVEKDLWKAMTGVKAIVLCVRHSPYLVLDPDAVVRAVGRPCAVIDCFLILDDAKIRRYLELGCEVKGLGRGHVKRIKEDLRRAALPADGRPGATGSSPPRAQPGTGSAPRPS
jgi:UDP-N-acetyl-D-glucosamine dehydrogenase